MTWWPLLKLIILVSLATPIAAYIESTRSGRTVLEVEARGAVHAPSSLIRLEEKHPHIPSIFQWEKASTSDVRSGPGAAARHLLQHLGLRPSEDPAEGETNSTGKEETKESDVDTQHKAVPTQNLHHSKSKLFGLPSYAAVLLGGLAAALIMICTNMIGNRLAHPLPFFATEEQKLRDKIEEAREKVRLLEAALEEKREQEKKQEEEEARRAAGEPKQPDGPSHEELLGEMLYRTQEVQQGAVGAVNDSIKQAAPLLARAAHVQNVFSENMKLVQDRAGELALKEASTVYSKLKEALGGEDNQADLANLAMTWNESEMPFANWFRSEDEADVDPPPFSLLLGGMFAPAQIKMTKGQCNAQIAWDSVMLAICTACLIMDYHHGCPDKLVWVWTFGMLGTNIVDVLCCSFIVSRCSSVLGMLQDAEDTMVKVPKTGNGVWDMYIMLQANSGQFFQAYFAYQGIIDCPTYTLQKCMSIISMVFGGLGVYVSIADIVADSLTCDAKVVLWFMHMYSWFFVLFFIWSSLGLVVWLLHMVSGLPIVNAHIMSMAKDSDEEVPFRMPLYQTLARSFLCQDSASALKIKAKQVDMDIANLEKDIEETKNKLSYKKNYIGQLESRRAAAASHEKELVDKYKEKLQQEGGVESEDVAEGAVAGAMSATPTAEELFQRAHEAASGATSHPTFTGGLQSAGGSIREADEAESY